MTVYTTINGNTENTNKNTLYIYNKHYRKFSFSILSVISHKEEVYTHLSTKYKPWHPVNDTLKNLIRLIIWYLNRLFTSLCKWMKYLRPWT
jgi:hypothetical protein